MARSLKAAAWLSGIVCGCLLWGAVAQAGELRSEKHQEYAKTIWSIVGEDGAYTSWNSTEDSPGFDFGPPGCGICKHFLNPIAGRTQGNWAQGALIVTEHYDGDTLVGITAWRKARDGYDERNADWYWAHYTPSGEVVKTSADKSEFAKPGFVAMEEDGRLWVFHVNCSELDGFFANGELAKHTTRPAAGPQGMTLKAPDGDTILSYIAAKDGFETLVRDERLWVFEEGSEELAALLKDGELAKHVTRPAAGPLGVTIKAPDPETLDKYLYGKPGFVLRPVEGRLWIFKEGSEELAAFDKDGELAKHVTRPGAGPDGITVKAPDTETLNEYLTAAEGFVTFLDDEGRLWVFTKGCSELEAFNEHGELAKHVTRPVAGPDGLTVKAPDTETLDAYLKTVQ
jgi:sugar lactone lactonase YvrE